MLVVLLRGNFTFRARAKQEEPVFIIEPRIKLNYKCFGIRLSTMERNFFQYISFIFFLFSNNIYLFFYFQTLLYLLYPYNFM